MSSFIDYTKIHVKAGDGGNGCVGFRREKFIPKGGPAGGDGGRGGNVIIVVDPQMNTLLDFKYKRIYKADKGQNGMGALCAGKDGEDIILKVPRGTVVKDFETGEVLADMTEPGQEFMVAEGGNGGFGNARFKSSTNQAPMFAKPGLPGEELDLILELKVMADIGIIGLPNAGKSTLLSVLTNATPKIAGYPFTTIKPNLGVMAYDDKQLVFADIPGLIEGAAEGKGLGDAFLRHIERTRFLVHMIDVTDHTADIVTNYKVIRNELKKYNPSLSKRPEIIVLNKIDAVNDRDELKTLKKQLPKASKIFELSAATGEGIQELKQGILKKFFSDK